MTTYMTQSQALFFMTFLNVSELEESLAREKHPVERKEGEPNDK